MSDFSDRPFVAGSVVGLRAFSVDKLGRLYGPSFNQVFTPGENVATCRKSEVSTGGWFLPGGPVFTPHLTFATHYAPPPPPDESFLRKALGLPPKKSEPDGTLAEEAVAVREVQKPKHSLAGLGCTCGFYAYFDGQNDYKEPQRIAAIVEGYGVCTVGDRGFRAEKARLLGLIVPGKRFAPAILARVAHNYADITFYGTKREALDAHPLTAPDVPTPETDDTFWTRSVR